MKKALLAIAMVMGAAQAHAFTAPAWACSLGFKGSEEGVKILVGSFEFNGKGDLACVSPTGQTAHYPVTINMKAAPLSPQIAFGHIDLYGQAADISLLNTNPESILGTYYVAQGQAAVVGGVGILTAVHTDFPELSLKLSLQFAKGFGVNLGFNKMTIALDQSRL